MVSTQKKNTTTVRYDTIEVETGLNVTDNRENCTLRTFLTKSNCLANRFHFAVRV